MYFDEKSVIWEPKKRTCNNCEFNFIHLGICATHHSVNGIDIYGKNINEVKKMFPNGCEEWEISYSAFEKLNT